MSSSTPPKRTHSSRSLLSHDCDKTLEVISFKSKKGLFGFVVSEVLVTLSWTSRFRAYSKTARHAGEYVGKQGLLILRQPENKTGESMVSSTLITMGAPIA